MSERYWLCNHNTAIHSLTGNWWSEDIFNKCLLHVWDYMVPLFSVLNLYHSVSQENVGTGKQRGIYPTPYELYNQLPWMISIKEWGWVKTILAFPILEFRVSHGKISLSVLYLNYVFSYFSTRYPQSFMTLTLVKGEFQQFVDKSHVLYLRIEL